MNAKTKQARRVSVDIDIDTLEFGHIYDDDGEPIAVRTIDDVIIETAAAMLVKTIRNDTERYDNFRTKVTKRFDEILSETLRPLIEAELVLMRPLTEKVEAGIAAYFTEKSVEHPWRKNDRSNYGKVMVTPIEAWVAHGASKKTKDMMQAALNEGRDQVREVLKETGAQLIADAIDKMANGKATR